MSYCIFNVNIGLMTIEDVGWRHRHGQNRAVTQLRK